MTIEPLPMTLNAEDFSEAAGTRSPGLHLSQIIGVLNEARGGAVYKDTDPAQKQIYFATGFIWERVLKLLFLETAVKVREGALIRPGEFVRDGIAMSPDAIDVSEFVLEEYKATYLSSNHPIDDPVFWHWMVQMKCYCKAIGCRTARLRVWFIGGNWRGSGPEVKAWTLYFSDREVDEAFQMCVNTAKSKGWL